MEVYYRRYKVALSTATVEKCNATNNMELNKAYADEDDEDVTNSFQVMCLIMSDYLD